MPRDGSGNYTLPAGNPVVDGTTIETTWANPTMNDIAVQLNNVITRDGLLGATAPIKLVDGTAALPGVSFNAATGTGMYRTSTVLGFSWAGVSKMTITSAGVTIPAGTFTGTFNGNASSASSAAAVSIGLNSSINASFPIPFVSTGSGTASIYSDTGLTYNPSTNTITGNITSSDAADAVLVTAVATNSSFPVLLSAGTGSTAVYADTAGLFFNPSTNRLTTVSFEATGPGGINGKTPVANVTAPAVATDLATAITAVNAIRTALINFGIFT